LLKIHVTSALQYVFILLTLLSLHTSPGVGRLAYDRLTWRTIELTDLVD